jgi:hypothetical protein
MTVMVLIERISVAIHAWIAGYYLARDRTVHVPRRIARRVGKKRKVW